MKNDKEFKYIGSISSGTMRAEDLIPVFLEVLGGIDPDAKRVVEKSYGACIPDSEEDQDAMLEELFDILDAFAPPYFYFGANAADGADYGFWFSHVAFQMGLDDGEVIRTSQTPGYIAQVSDHGDITLLDLKGNVIWSIA